MVGVSEGEREEGRGRQRGRVSQWLIHLCTNQYNILCHTLSDTLSVMPLEPAEILANPVSTVGSQWTMSDVLG